MAKREMPKAPQFADYPQKRRFEFFSHTVDTENGNTHAVEMDLDASFVGVVQLKDSPVFRAIFLRNETAFDKANKAYENEVNALVAEAEKEGASINSLSDLEAWVNGEDPQAEPIDFAAMVAKINEAAKGQD